MKKEIIIGVTGASGAICAREVIQALLRSDEVARIHLVLSKYSHQTIRVELGVRGDRESSLRRALVGTSTSRVVFHSPENMAAGISSGTFLTQGMVIVPCSAGTFGAIASGATTNLIHRAADVTLKERRPLVLAVRETPLNAIHLENLLRLSRAGATIFPLTPSFYTRPRNLQEVVDQFTGRVLDLIEVKHNIGKRWGS